VPNRSVRCSSRSSGDGDAAYNPQNQVAGLVLGDEQADATGCPPLGAWCLVLVGDRDVWLAV